MGETQPETAELSLRGPTESGAAGGVAAGGGMAAGMSTEIEFTFNIDEAQFEVLWQEAAAKIESSLTVVDEQDATVEAYRWDQLEKWILQGYQQQAKRLAMQVARLEFMQKAMSQSIEVNLKQTFQAWASHFNNRLNDMVTNIVVNVAQGR
ncbi:MAG: hypothetical protein OEU26_30570 [Candidatus Tectomicrobia bacterium]|nr:hypothetical protein [Candidatus Tectomicrobia bacterium]